MKDSYGAREWSVIVGVVIMVALTAWFIFRPFSGMTARDISTEYGARTGTAIRSVNGTSVFGQMFKQRGPTVTTWTRLSPRLRRSDVIVWAPNSFELPTGQVIDYFEDEWLSLDDYRFRTLIYVARDFDAAVEYWETQAKTTTGTSYLESRSQAARMKSDHALGRSMTAVELDCDWFSIESNQSFVETTVTNGEWMSDLDRKIELQVAGKLELPTSPQGGRKYEVLLGSRETPLIVRLTDDYAWPDSQVIIVLNGASVLNLPLVEHQNREIASKLIDECGDELRRVTFLETGPAGVPISTSDPKAYSGFSALKIWPINSILMHLIVAGVLFCAYVFPIFGRPRKLETDTPSSFSKHIRAMGELLAITQDRQGAIDKVQQYRNLKIEPLIPEATNTPEKAGNPFQQSEI